MFGSRLSRAIGMSIPIVTGIALSAILIPSAGAAVPQTPSFGPQIEGLSPFQSEAGCNPVDRAGTKALVSLLRTTYPGHDIGSSRGCDGTASSHHIGRAIDFSAGSAAQRADVDAFIGWLLATDGRGNKFAMARRLGVMYIIYNRRQWKSYSGGGAWYAYTGTSDPHTDHVHISLNWAGADKQTSFWSGSYGPPPVQSQSTVQGDFTGDGNVDAAIFYNYDNAQTRIFLYKGNGQGGIASPTIAWDSGVGAWDATRIRSFVGDYNRDGKADIGAFYDYGSAQTKLWMFYSNGSSFTTAQLWDSGRGNWELSRSQVFAGDFTGDGTFDVGLFYRYDDALARIFVFKGNGAGGVGAPTVAWDGGPGNWDGTRTKGVVGDFNRDGKADIGAFYDYGSAQTKLWMFYSNGSSFTTAQLWDSGRGNWELSRSQVLAGDFNGDGSLDVDLFYTYDSAQTRLFHFRGNGTGGVAGPVISWDSGPGNWDGARTKAFVGDYNRDGKADVGAFYNYDNAQTGLWMFTSIGNAFGTTLLWDSGRNGFDWSRTLIA